MKGLTARQAQNAAKKNDAPVVVTGASGANSASDTNVTGGPGSALED